jgi:hypothetical protein
MQDVGSIVLYGTLGNKIQHGKRAMVTTNTEIILTVHCRESKHRELLQ